MDRFSKLSVRLYQFGSSGRLVCCVRVGRPYTFSMNDSELMGNKGGYNFFPIVINRLLIILQILDASLKNKNICKLSAVIKKTFENY